MTVGTTKETFLSAWSALEAGGHVGGPSWLRDVRRAAIGRFAERGLPTRRDEEWKYTSIAPIAETPFDLGADRTDDELTEEMIAPFCLSPEWRRLVFVNGRYCAKLSTVGSLPRGVRIESLGEALYTDAEMLRPHLITSASAETPEAFAALNTAFWRDGAFVYVPAGADVTEPVHLLFVATAPGPPRIDHPRNLIVLERESHATLVEGYVTLGGDAYLTNAMDDIIVGSGASLDHCKIQLEGQRAFHVGRTQVRLARASHVGSCSVTFGGRLVRNDVHAHMGAEAASCALSGLFVIGGRQHVDTHTVVDHAAPRAMSRQLYKGILDCRARGVFNGRVIVRPGANGTDAHQTNKNLLLSDEVEVDSKPQLEIFADDVKCSHGAADGQVAADAVFYLKSRGLDEAAAMRLLTVGFANEVLGRIRVEPVRAWLESLLTARLEGGRVLEEKGMPCT
ncbi:MAG TPA: Fe-S cluster assembly protein SufD [Methylomirabilota bacterium]|jgi:Fe-S cluster assembly protein SufD|nr:Fe-S cluster assembly protein SufD [Methylomirabilota bacterium]